MKVLLSVVLAVLAAGGLSQACAAEEMGKAMKSETPAAAATMEQAQYMCDKCHVLSETPGKCPKCGMEMTKTHVLAVKEGMAYCCRCGADCKCKDMNDAMTKCSCGKDVIKVDIKGKYVCGCYPDKGCTMVSDKEGKCMCGKDMKKIE